jgi:hypothetical protein
LRAFVEVVRQGGFTQAAKKVFATQSTVSKAIKHAKRSLERALPATRKRYAHRLANVLGTNFQNAIRSDIQNDAGDDGAAIA